MVANTGKNRILKDLFWGLEEDAVDKITISLSLWAYQVVLAYFDYYLNIIAKEM
jgi:hypothetical protein